MPKENGVWAVVLFDLPVQTQMQQRAANQFRKLLKDQGFTMHQYSVYVRYAASVAAHQRQHAAIKAGLPEFGEVTILLLSDKSWANARRFVGKKPLIQDGPPRQLTIF